MLISKLKECRSIGTGDKHQPTTPAKTKPPTEQLINISELARQDGLLQV
jgi:hypothetical protein